MVTEIGVWVWSQTPPNTPYGNTVSQQSAIRKTYDQMIKDGRPVYLFSGYLDKRSKTKASGDTALAFAVRVAIEVPLYEVDKRFWFDDYFEGGYVFDETITIIICKYEMSAIYLNK